MAGGARELRKKHFGLQYLCDSGIVAGIQRSTNLASRLVPALLLGTLLKPGWLWAFATGVITSAALGERYEQMAIDRFSGPFANNAAVDDHSAADTGYLQGWYETK